MATLNAEHRVGCTIKETPRVFRDEWGGYATKVLDLKWGDLTANVGEPIEKNIRKHNKKTTTIEPKTFELADFLELTGDQKVMVERTMSSDHNFVYNFCCNDTIKPKRQVTVEVLKGGGNYIVKLIADEEPENPKEGNESLAQRRLRVSFNENKKAAHYITDERLVVNNKWEGGYEAKGIEYSHKAESDNRVSCRVSNYVDQDTEEPTIANVRWNSAQPWHKTDVKDLASANYPLNWLSSNLPHDKSLQELPPERFISSYKKASE